MSAFVPHSRLALVEQLEYVYIYITFWNIPCEKSSPIPYTSCTPLHDARFRETATTVGDTTPRIEHFAPSNATNIRFKYAWITNTMAELLEESQISATANARISTTAELSTIPSNQQPTQKMVAAPSVLLSCGWNRRCSWRSIRLQPGGGSNLTQTPLQHRLARTGS